MLIVELHLEFCKRSAFIYTFTDYIYIDKYRYIHTHIYIFICTYIYICVCVFVCVYLFWVSTFISVIYFYITFRQKLCIHEPQYKRKMFGILIFLLKNSSSETIIKKQIFKSYLISSLMDKIVITSIFFYQRKNFKNY